MNELRDMIIEDFKLLFEKNSKTIDLAIARRDNLRAEAMLKDVVDLQGAISDLLARVR